MFCLSCHDLSSFNVLRDLRRILSFTSKIDQFKVQLNEYACRSFFHVKVQLKVDMKMDLFSTRNMN